jgi:hypothetical protein
MLSIIGICCLGCNQQAVVRNVAVNTAAYSLNDANNLADSYGIGLRLMGISGINIKEDGTAETWSYGYADTLLPPTYHWFQSTDRTVVFDSNTSTPLGLGVITHSWLNSDSALRIADRNGGLIYRSRNPGYTIAALLGEPAAPNPTTYWWITYHSKGDSATPFLVTIDARTGDVSFKSR